jgi:carbon monoxide dehydrogenase subunit G
MYFEATIYISCPIHEVYRYMTTLTNLQKWIPTITAVQTTSGPIRVGMTADLYHHNNLHSRMEVIKCQQPISCIFRVSSGYGPLTILWHLTYNDDKTYVRYQYEANWANYLAKMQGKVNIVNLIATTQSQLQISLRKLQQLLEEQEKRADMR